MSWLRAPRTLHWSALAVLLAIYAIASLEPFNWRIPPRVVNGAVPIADGWAFPTRGIVIARPPLAWLESAQQAEFLELSLEVRPQTGNQSGPARILTISDDLEDRNLTLGQDGRDLVLRLRSEDTDSNGMRQGHAVARLENVLATGRWVAIDVGIHPGKLTIAIDGRPELEAALPPAVLATWDASFGLALGNEMTCNRPWLGEIRKPVITAPAGATSYAEVRQVDLPVACRAIRHRPKLVPLFPLYPGDALRNLVMYVPLGCLLGLMVRSRSARVFSALALAIAGVSLAFECAQLLVASRFASVDDLIFNTLGGALGLWLGFWLKKRAAATRPG